MYCEYMLRELIVKTLVMGLVTQNQIKNKMTSRQYLAQQSKSSDNLLRNMQVSYQISASGIEPGRYLG